MPYIGSKNSIQHKSPIPVGYYCTTKKNKGKVQKAISCPSITRSLCRDLTDDSSLNIVKISEVTIVSSAIVPIQRYNGRK